MMQDINNFNAVVHEFPEYQNIVREFETVVDQFEDVFLSLNRRGEVRHVNSAYEKLILLGRQGLVGRHIEDIQRSPRNLVSLFKQASESRKRVTMPVALPTGQVFRAAPRLRSTIRAICSA